MSSFLFFALASYGVAFLARSASILSRPRLWLRVRFRTLDALLSCAFCVGFWSSLAVASAATALPPRTLLDLAVLVLTALAGASAVYVLDAAVVLVETASEALGRLERLEARWTGDLSGEGVETPGREESEP